MTPEEIIEMARQAGIPFNKWGMVGCEDCEQDIDQNLVAFAKLVAAKERDACAKVCESHGSTLANGAMLAEAIRVRGEA